MTVAPDPAAIVRAPRKKPAPGAAPPVLLEAKLQPPRARSEWLARTELVQHLSGIAAKLILIEAPAGSGKTTLVAQWHASSAGSRRFAWLSLDRGDNDPVRLWWHVTGALQRACPELGGRVPRLSRAALPKLGNMLLVALASQLAALRTPVVLVLDDYHEIREPTCHEQTEALLRYLPRSVQVVLITRADPPLRLARLRAAGDVAEIGARELRFSRADAAALVRAAGGIRLSEPDLTALVTRTEGWPAGVYLAALSLRGNPEPGTLVRQATAGNRFIASFLAEEVLNGQPPDVRQFLLRTSILERFTAPLCDAVAGTGNAVDVIGHLVRENLFVVPIGGQRCWYRYQHLFGQVLRDRLARTEPGLVPVLHGRASAWHRVSGSVEEAVAHAQSAGDLRGAVDLIAAHWHGYVDAGRMATVRGWIGSLGDGQIAADPVAAHCAAWIAALSGDRDGVLRWLGAFEEARHDDRMSPLPDGMRSLKFSAALLRATFGFEGIRVMRESAAEATGMENDRSSPWYALARAALGFSMHLSGRPGAAAVLQDALLAGASPPLIRMYALGVAALVAADEGRLAQANQLADQAWRIVRGGPATFPENPIVLVALGAIRSRQGRLHEARAGFERAISGWRHWFALSPWLSVDTQLRLAPVLLETGDRPAAAAALADAGQALAWSPDGAGALQARLSRLERRLAGASLGTPSAEPLTEREEAVLRLLRGTLSLRGIGRELYVSRNTIKAHTRAIYRKLGVSTRRDAVERAREHGILA
ncbi:MAG TPA: LuxR C-terminal-related transcriptional regulator [Streptosporangiaceae bacterium]|nr:LuxR C-terminal-related transcriptional regulator [Streptosporangiaceae bacterium]